MAMKRKGECSKTGGRARGTRAIQVKEHAWNGCGQGNMCSTWNAKEGNTCTWGAVLSSMPQDKQDKLCKTVRDTRV